ncbi:MAG: family 43 glycosylhydrolase [Chitinophagaceae bacterium]|nr:family 43 glycosylhydrolase [Chitinophagaceae bacterium]
MPYRFKPLLALFLGVLAVNLLFAQNPLITNQYTADPTARVFGDRVYIFPSHDILAQEGKGRIGWFCMEDYHVFSSNDLTNWTDHGVIVQQNKVPWVRPDSYSMWAPDCIERNGKYYFYFPTSAADTTKYGRGFSIGVAIADRPEGPYVPEPTPIIGVHGIDPNVLIDDDGQAYLYWSAGNIYGAKLKPNMLELDSEVKILGDLPTKGLKEGPFVFKRNGLYYLTYPHVENKIERLEYAVSKDPLGPFKITGVIMDESASGCWTNHQSIMNFKGQWYLFYHDKDLSPNFDKARSIRADSLFFNEDGTIRKVIPTLRGIGVSAAHQKIQLDRYSEINPVGTSVDFLDTTNRFLGWKTNFEKQGAWVKYNTVDFAKKKFTHVWVRARSLNGGSLEIRSKSASGAVLAKGKLDPGANWYTYKWPVLISPTGINDVVVKSVSEGQIELDWIQFEPAQATNPVVFADVPDMSMIRVGDTYYASSTTMHYNPGVPIMKSKDLVNWKLIGYAYDTLANLDELNLENGKSTYGRGSWASSLRYHKGLYYVSTFAQTTNKTHIFVTSDIEKGKWKRIEFGPSLHDHSLFFDDDGKVYLLYGNKKLTLVELKADLSGLKPGGLNQVVVENSTQPTDGIAPSGLGEGSQLFKVKGKYYLFNITWPRGGMRTVVVHRADKITGPYEGRIALQHLGVAQGGLIDMPNGNWYSYLFRDNGSVGRIPYLVPVKWVDGWPVLGEEGKVPDLLNLPAKKSLIPGIVASDEFVRKTGEPKLPLVWQWNHNPDNKLWSLEKRKGFLRLTTGRVDTSFYLVRNLLTQRTIGPVCSGTTSLDITNMKDGDFAGMALYQKRYGQVGVKQEAGKKWIVMVSAESENAVEKERIPLEQGTVFFRISCDFTDRADTGYFFYSLDGKNWTPIGAPLKMTYTLPHFTGYRFALFNYATQQAGGFVDFDYFRIRE